MDAVRDVLNDLLGYKLETCQEEGVNSDGILKQGVALGDAYFLVLEMKNEIGTGHSDPYRQACISYQKYYSSPTGESGNIPAELGSYLPYRK